MENSNYRHYRLATCDEAKIRAQLIAEIEHKLRVQQAYENGWWRGFLLGLGIWAMTAIASWAILWKMFE